MDKRECRWRFTLGNEEEQTAWETGCGQWCVDSESTPTHDGFRNGFQFCPYCGETLVLLLKAAEVAA